MKFVEKNRTGEVLGNKIICKPVPFALALAGMTAESDTDRIKALAEVVKACILLEDGTPVDIETLSVSAIAELGAFALAGKGDLADFT